MAANEKAVKPVENIETNIPEEDKVNALLVKDEYGNRYKLEFTLRVVKAMERNGFKVDMEYPVTTAEELFKGAFQANYGGKITNERVEKIWNHQTHKMQLLTKLVAMYMNPVKEFLEDAEGTKETDDPTWETL